MKSPWIKVGSKSSHWYLVRGHGETQKEEGRVKTLAEIGVMWPQVN